MSAGTGMPRGRSTGRLIAFYAVLTAISIAVVVVVVQQGRTAKAQPAIAGGYAANAPVPCLGPVPAKPGGAALPPTAPAQPAASGPLFNLLQSGQFVNFTNNQSTLGGQLRLNAKTLANGGHRLTGTG